MKFETSDQLSFLLPNVYPGNGNVEQLKCVQDLDETHLFVSTEVVEQLKVHLRTLKGLGLFWTEQGQNDRDADQTIAVTEKDRTIEESGRSKKMFCLKKKKYICIYK